ncbi:acyltransferase [Pseudomonas sp. BLCC-B13]|uniref:acyltransferase family protein n=1 Tax=Pseudomonas sp. BLCC-B13 TaxID=3025314 RepID=UPI00234E4D9B|nr:acyltransferase [Pseudomonas sp. BLCC-B13]MDC7825597.1 acyltransferase [Pseudomonas sp. BLCC-B13]
MQEPASAANRLFGLDICRTIACLAVVFGHMLGHSSPPTLIYSLGFVGSFGVDLFFCLSGFLIGRILLKESANWHNQREAGLLRFWHRRWMRTLPLYFFFFLVSLKYDWKGATSLTEQYPYIFFAQNFAWPMTDFFRLSWSLAVEEWFYYSFPLLILLLIGLGANSRQSSALAIIAFTLTPLVFRLMMPESFPRPDDAKYIVIYRLDAIGYGVLAAYIFMFHKNIFDKLARYWIIPSSMALGIMLMAKNGYPWREANTTFTALYFTASGIIFAALIPFFYKLRPTNSNLINRFVELTSLISYSIYLGHIFAFILVIKLLNISGLYDSIYPNAWLLYPTFTACVYLLATLTYQLIEKPFLRLRDTKISLSKIVRLARLRG